MKPEERTLAVASTPEQRHSHVQQPAKPERTDLLATAALIGAGLASACCVVPLLLVSVGISGAWIANLTALEPYKPYVGAATLALLGYGFWHVYFKPKPPCEDGTYCARPASARNTKIVLWLGLAIVILALTIDWWAPWFY
ncbi:MAG: mercury transporter MerT [Proteobacteria bacterium]|nr:mercury transporter MerT [Pseudomonadota bacterium]